MKQKNIPILIVILVIAAALGGGFLVTRPPQQISQPSPIPDVNRGCRPTGCSGQVCSDEDVITTCEYRAEYACFKNAKCERQKDGKCGWTQTEELRKCIEEAKNSEVIQ